MRFTVKVKDGVKPDVSLLCKLHFVFVKSPRTNFATFSNLGESKLGKKFRDRNELLIGATSRFVHLGKFSLNFSSSLCEIRVNLLHP